MQIPDDLNLPLPARRDTRRLGYALASALRAGDLVVLEGDLAAGKTFLVRAVARGMGVPTSVPVTSPTFELVHELPGGRVPILHIDLYRIESAGQLAELGLFERIGRDAVLLVEWGDRFSDALGNEGLWIYMRLTDSGGRLVRFQARGERGNALLERLSRG